MEEDRGAAQRLIDQPPCYSDASSDGPREQFEIEDESEWEANGRRDPEQGSQRAQMGWLHSVKEFGEQRITIPVRYLIDPITNFYNGCSMWIDSKLNRLVNPLLARRFFVVFVACGLILLVRLKFSSSFRSVGNLRDHDILRRDLRSKIDVNNLKELTEYFGKMPHFAGSMADDSTSNYVHDYFKSLGLPATYDRHDVFLTHGNSSMCELKVRGDVKWSSDLLEGSALKDPTASQKQPYTHMALSLPGEAEGQLVYANYGSELDLEEVDVDGRIAIVKYGSEMPGEVAIRLEHKGARGVLFMSEKHPKEPSWPEGSDYPADAVQQGSLGWPSLYPGDVLSPGWPSNIMLTVNDDATYLAHIPVTAISWNDAEPLLNSLRGHGLRVDRGQADWSNHGAPSGVKEWWTGPNPESTVRLAVHPAVERRHEVRNVFGHLAGREMGDRAVIIGARMDTPCYGSSQLSGLNVMLEAARIFADMKYTDQWEPLRSIYFMAWDATTMNYAGVTEWVENVADKLSLEGIAYIDLDLGISGPDFVVQGNPVIEVEDLLKKVAFNDHTLFDAVDRDKSFRPIPGFGNHVAFEAHTGVPTIKLGFESAAKPVPRDSCFDNSLWMARFGDPDHSRHFALTEFAAYLLLELSDAPLIPFDYKTLGQEIHRYINELDTSAASILGSDKDWAKAIQESLARARLVANEVMNSGDLYAKARSQWRDFAHEMRDPTSGDLPDSQQISRVRTLWNERVAQANKFTLDRNGIARRNWYKNHLFGPEAAKVPHGHLAGNFPAVQDALNSASPSAFCDTLNDASAHMQVMADFLGMLL